MTMPSVPLYTRLPEIYRIRDEEIRDQQHLPAGPLAAYLGIVEEAFSAIHSNIDALYDDLFIETAADWVIPYIGDLLGNTPLSGDAWTLRADVADTIALRRRKGTLGAIELLTLNLTRWGVRCVELRENLVWLQHLNHQRPDIGGLPPYGQPGMTRNTPIRGGTIPLRDPALLSQIGTPFDPFGHIPDVTAHTDAAIRYNLPNLAIFLWRLGTYRIPLSRPSTHAVQTIAAPVPGEAPFQVRFDIFPLDRPVQLFNLRRGTAVRRIDPTQAISLTEPDEAPGPIPMARLTDDTPAGNPAAYVSVETYDPGLGPDQIDIGDTALQLHVPQAQFTGSTWQFRGGNLFIWEAGLDRPVANREVVIDPGIGRLQAGVATLAEANALADNLLLTFTYGANGDGANSIGAHPISRPSAPATLDGSATVVREVSAFTAPNDLQTKLGGLNAEVNPIVLEITDSMVHDLDLAAVTGVLNEAGGPNLRLNRGLVIRAADGCRPIVRLRRPLRFRTVDPANAGFTLRLEGLFLTRVAGFPAGEPLIARAAVGGLELLDCTLDPEHYRTRDCQVTPVQTSVVLRDGYGFANPAVFSETPAVHIQRTITGPLRIDTGYALDIRDSIIDGGSGVADVPGNAFALTAAADPVNGWGPRTTIDCVTFFGRSRVHQIDGRGGIWVDTLEVQNNQVGCIKYSCFAGLADRLPQNHACVDATDAHLRFVSELFGDAAYGQLRATSDFRIRERGPGDDEMGAFNFLKEAHKWRNIQVRYREFMPVGVRPLLIPVT